jgi:hypothetical protein
MPTSTRLRCAPSLLSQWPPRPDGRGWSAHGPARGGDADDVRSPALPAPRPSGANGQHCVVLSSARFCASPSWHTGAPAPASVTSPGYRGEFHEIHQRHTRWRSIAGRPRDERLPRGRCGPVRRSCAFTRRAGSGHCRAGDRYRGEDRAGAATANRPRVPVPRLPALRLRSGPGRQRAAALPGSARGSEVPAGQRGRDLPRDLVRLRRNHGRG